MKINQKLLNELAELVFLSLEDGLSEEKHQKLESLLEREPLARKYYFRLINTYLGVQEPNNLKALHDRDQDVPYDIELWKALAENEATAPGIHIEKPGEKPIEMGLMKVEKLERKISRLSVYTLILSAAAMLLLIIMVLSSPIRPIVATLTDSINAEWINTKDIPTDGDPLRQGELTLARGLVEITFDNGAVVVVEAPAVIELEGPKAMFLTSGRISAVVSQYAIGFTVNTLSGSIVDLGTEFGVSVENDGSCDLHMFKGRANLIVGRNDEKKASQIVNANEARSVDFVTGEVEDIDLSEKGFVRQIDSEKGLIWRGQDLQLADIVGGGNGFGSGTSDIAIDPGSGEVIDSFLATYVMSDRNYHPVTSLPFIDGVFVPDGQAGPVITTSAGHLFDSCPDTRGESWGAIYKDGRYSVDHETVYLRNWRNYEILLLDGEEYMGNPKSAITMHSNSGITFDLDAIRNEFPELDIVGFSALFGIADNVTERAGGDSVPKVDIWVLVDGQIQHSQTAVEPDNGTENIQFTIESDNRFLTLIVTDAGGETGLDWAIFADPVLDLSVRPNIADELKYTDHN